MKALSIDYSWEDLLVTDNLLNICSQSILTLSSTANMSDQRDAGVRGEPRHQPGAAGGPAAAQHGEAAAGALAAGTHPPRHGAHGRRSLLPGCVTVTFVESAN